MREHGALFVSTVVVAEVVLGIPDAARHAEAVEALASGTKLVAPTGEDWVKASEVTAPVETGSRIRKGKKCQTEEEWAREDEERTRMSPSTRVTEGQGDSLTRSPPH